ncbi:MAG: sulfate ABC transporter permease subunit CysT [Deltaproteobacteria bacterium]|nr:sulfate ABC transporter permease subunit CysT [Deltaproteobacteria bacterium]MBN2672756.1 sulfate ABC transporter permease subunit CysT [Deltaproteobacteria bacterium]
MEHFAALTGAQAETAPRKAKNPLPGFGLSIGYTLTYLGILVLVPLSTIVFKTAAMPWREFWATISASRAIAAYGLSFVGALSAGAINCIFGTLLAWVLVRYRFLGRKLLDALIDLPFAVPTAVAGIALTAVWGPHGPIGEPLNNMGVQVAYARLGVLVAMVFVGLPFVVRTVQPVLDGLSADVEEAAATLGAGRVRTFFAVILPHMAPALFTGFALSFARALGEYGSIVFISGNMPGRTEITPLLIMTKLEQFDYRGATALAVVMLLASFAVLFMVNSIQWKRKSHSKSFATVPRVRSFLKG